MNSPREKALDLLRRLLAGERGLTSLHLAMLLEKSLPLASPDDLYRRILPPDLAELRLSPETTQEIIAALCAEISRNPDAALIGSVSFTGEELATKTAVNTLIHPPRPLTFEEIEVAMSIVRKYLPWGLSEDPEFVSREDLQSLARLVKDLENRTDTEIQGTSIKHFAPQILESLAALGIRDS